MTQISEEYISTLNSPAGRIKICATQTGVTAIRFIDNDVVTHENTITKQAKTQLKEYFNHERKTFELPLEPKGTAFQKMVWKQLMSVKFGELASYLDIATKLNSPKACRAVGAANGKNPISIVIPCHRVIGSNGKLTGYAGGLKRKAKLLELESSQTPFSLS